MRRVPLVVLIAALALPAPLAPLSVSRTPAGPATAWAAAAVERYVMAPGESQVIYRVGETLFRKGNRLNVAVGRTQDIRGEIIIDRNNPRNSRVGPITVDISQFQTDSGRRDQAIRERWLESARYPLAEFTPTAIQGLPATYVEGREITLEISGRLKVREAVRPTTFAVTLKLERETLAGTATATVQMTDFGFDPPVILGILRAENTVRLEFRFVARRTP